MICIFFTAGKLSNQSCGAFLLFRLQRKYIEEKRGRKLILLYDVKNCFCLLGSYDHKMKVFDARMDKSVLTMDHGQPVESLLLFPSEGLLVSAGGNSAKLNTLKCTLLPSCKCHTCLGTLHVLMCLCRPLNLDILSF